VSTRANGLTAFFSYASTRRLVTLESSGMCWMPMDSSSSLVSEEELSTPIAWDKAKALQTYTSHIALKHILKLSAQDGFPEALLQ
jgi:hypothetical protein